MLFALVQPSSSWVCAYLSITFLKISDLVPAENFVSLCQKMLNLENLYISQINVQVTNEKEKKKKLFMNISEYKLERAVMWKLCFF